ncbi:MAG: type IV pilus biogenesis/stability protein PilW [Pseudomonadota bacterium]
MKSYGLLGSWLRPAVLVAGALQIAGCVTTVEGNAPEQASDAERVIAHVDLARGYLAEGNYMRARSPLDKALSLDPNAVEANVLMAVVHQSEEEFELARQFYRRALRSDPSNAQALNNYGSFLYARGDHQEAAKHLRRAVADVAYPARAQAFENLGLAELSLQREDAAVKAFERALMLNNSQPRTNLELADIYYARGNVPLALGYYNQFRGNAQPSPRSLCLGMKLSAALGLDDQLASYTLALRNLFPGSPEANACEIRRG